MKALVLNLLLGICMGRFFSAWSMLLFVPILAAEVAYGVYMFDLGLSFGIRRAVMLLVTLELAFVLGVLLRPRSGAAWE